MRETLEFDVVIVGAGPAGLTTAIRLAQLQKNLSICIIEKSAHIGNHIIGGAVLEPSAINELIPDWQKLYPFTLTPAKHDVFLLLTQKHALRLPTPLPMRNKGNFILRLGQFCQWLASHAENLGVQIFPGFAATDIIMEENQVKGIITGQKGIDKNGNKTSRFQEGIEIYAKHLVLAEGSRGSTTERIINHYHLRKQSDPQTYALGIKELWEIPSSLHQAGTVMHTMGWPLPSSVYGGSFVYHLDQNLLSIGFVIGLDYKNPYLNPYEEFQRFKTHPAIKPLLEKSQRIAYGARCLNEGGYQSIPHLTFPGGLIVGDAAGFLNVPKIKGVHNAMKSGMIAADTIFNTMTKNIDTTEYESTLKNSNIIKELYQVRNIRPAMNWGLYAGLAYAALDTYIFRGKTPWTFHYSPDHTKLKLAKTCKPINYPKHDKKITFDLTDSLYLAHLQTNENQPPHLTLKDKHIPISVNYKKYASPETRYCPAGVYEILIKQGQPELHIHAANCIHCKACDIKDPTQNIVWIPPEGGDGPQYDGM